MDAFVRTVLDTKSSEGLFMGFKSSAQLSWKDVVRLGWCANR